MKTLREIAVHADGHVMRDGSFDSLGFVDHRRARMLVYVEEEKFLESAIGNSMISCIITSNAIAGSVPQHLGVLVARNPRLGFYNVQNVLVRDSSFYGNSKASDVSLSAEIHPTAFVAPHDVTIGERVVVGPHVTVLPGVTIEADCVVRAGAVLGSEGFQVFTHDDAPFRVAHGGTVRVCRGVDVHANTCVDRGLFGDETAIGPGATIDNLVQISHSVVIGALTRVAAGTVILGSVNIGRDVWIGPGATIASAVSIGDNATVSIGSVVTQDVPVGGRVSGNFAIDHERFVDHLRRIR